MKKPGILLAITPLVILIALLATAVVVFGDDSTSGAAQAVLLTSAVITACIGIFHLKIPWKEFEKSISENISDTAPVILILLMIGALTATWMLSGVVPTMIYYGLKIIHPKVFIVVTFILCAMISVLAGSSWTTVGTVGIALFGAGELIGLPAGWMAGAILSGAYLGDKLSPLSDAVNLASAISGTDLYKHTRYTIYTALPACIIALIVFTVVGFTVPTSGNISMEAHLSAIRSAFHISPWLLLVPCFTFFLVVKKVPAALTLFASAFLGGVILFIFQPQVATQITGGHEGFKAVFHGFFHVFSSHTSIETGDEMLNQLASTRGMAGMINTIWLVICIMTMGGCLSAGGMLTAITEFLLKKIHTTGSLVTATVCTCIVCNMVLADQYMAVLLPGRMFKDAYRKMGLAPEVLSRTLGDSATVTSVLVPWNTCAVFQSSVLGIATLAYFPFAIFCLVNPLIAIIVAFANYKIHRIDPETGVEIATATE
ncbi:MAG: Na+/H+ antiporter NhaC [Bacteroidales bacterium]|nr:Na+/H+ antiporter NhaC [Bacteroidales bacterium]